MDYGKLKEALPSYQKVMDKLPLQTAVLTLLPKIVTMIDRRNEAQAMYEKLQSHPDAEVCKKARQIKFSFQVVDVDRVMRTTGNRNDEG
ncbi:hypothetical protein RCOM_1453380 [Ricinus communis]|uniref:Uncharacterized protein n=1 Tax=Ricinus communis TaxID=3988 RepID=B9RGE5_RICCO|nr:hypothetical protein RCOM_1453380 [Ricinus communis]